MTAAKIQEMKTKKAHDPTWRIEEIYDLLNEENTKSLFKWADEVRKKYCGDEIHIRGIIEFSNFCKMNCCYCGLRCENRNIHRYRLSPEEIIELAAKIKNEYGINTVVLQSGEDDYFTAEILAEIIKGIKSKAEGIAITLCVGEHDEEFYRKLKEAGADRFLLKQEVFDEELYEPMHPGASYKNRVACISNLRKLDYQVGSGNLVGLPNQTLQNLACDIYSFYKYKFDMIACGPFIPHQDTPYAAFPCGDPELTLKVIAVTRIVTQKAHIPATTALGAIDKNYQILAFQAGANIIMINFTPPAHRKDYDIYPSKDRLTSDPLKKLEEIKNTIHSIGRRVGKGRGDSLQ